MATSLMADVCENVPDAVRRFADESNNGVLVYRPRKISCCRCGGYLIVPSACYALVTSQGADLNYTDGSPVWPSGLHLLYPPWVRIEALVTKKSTVFEISMKSTTKDDIVIEINIAIIFRIMGDKDRGEDPYLVRTFVNEVEPWRLEVQFREVISEEIRRITQKSFHDAVYCMVGRNFTNNQQHIGLEIQQKIDQRFRAQGVEIEAVAVKSVKLPDDIYNILSDVTLTESLVEEQNLHAEYQATKDKLNDEIESHLKIYEDMWKDETKRYKERESEEITKIEQFVAEANITEAQIREESAAKTNIIYAESRLMKQRIDDSINRIIAAYEVGSNKFAAELVADTKADTKKRLSEVQLAASAKENQASVLLSQAEGKVATMLRKKRQFETQLKELELFSHLSENRCNILVSTTENQDSNSNEEERIRLMMLADSILHDVPGGGRGPDGGFVLAERTIRKDELLRVQHEPKRQNEQLQTHVSQKDAVRKDRAAQDSSQRVRLHQRRSPKSRRDSSSQGRRKNSKREEEENSEDDDAFLDRILS